MVRRPDYQPIKQVAKEPGPTKSQAERQEDSLVFHDRPRMAKEPIPMCGAAGAEKYGLRLSQSARASRTTRCSETEVRTGWPITHQNRPDDVFALGPGGVMNTARQSQRKLRQKCCLSRAEPGYGNRCYGIKANERASREIKCDRPQDDSRPPSTRDA